MKNLITRIAIALVLTSLMGVNAFAFKSKKEAVRIPHDIKVNGTLVKAGNYEVQFEEEKAELSIIRNGKVVARANTTTEKRDKKAKTLELRTSGSGDEAQLSKVAFAGMDQNLVISNTAASN